MGGGNRGAPAPWGHCGRPAVLPGARSKRSRPFLDTAAPGRTGVSTPPGEPTRHHLGRKRAMGRCGTKAGPGCLRQVAAGKQR